MKSKTFKQFLKEEIKIERLTPLQYSSIFRAFAKSESLLRETCYRCKLALPTNQQDLDWFEEGCDVTKSDFSIRLWDRLKIGQRKYEKQNDF